MTTEVLYEDGSTAVFDDNGGSSHDGYLAIERLRLITAKSALEIYLKYDGKVQLTANGAQMAIKNVIEPLTGKTYKRSLKGKREALEDCLYVLDAIENNAVIWEGE